MACGYRLAAGFAEERRGRRSVIYRCELAETVADPYAAFDQAAAAGAGARRRGDGASARAASIGPVRAVVRRYLHGGALGGLFPPTFPGSERLRRELAVAEHAWRAGAPVAEPLGGIIDRLAPLVCRLWLVTREIADAEDGLALWRRLEGETDPRRATLKRVAMNAAGVAVRRLHDAGVLHADLHVKNLLFQPAGAATRAFVLDLDKSRIVPRLARRARLANLRRLARSIDKRDPRAQFLTGRDRLRLLRAYLGPDRTPELREWAAALARPQRWHRLWWMLWPNGT